MLERPPDEAEDRLVQGDGGAQVQVQRLPQPLAVLDRERAVEAQVVTKHGPLGVRSVRAQQARGGVPRDQVDEHEDDDRGSQQDRDEEQEPPSYVAEH